MPDLRTASSTIPLPLRPLGSLRSATREEIETANKDAHPLLKQSFLSSIGEVITIFAGTNLLTATNGAFGYFTAIVGLGITGLGFILKPDFSIAKKEKDLPAPPSPELETNPLETPKEEPLAGYPSYYSFYVHAGQQIEIPLEAQADTTIQPDASHSSTEATPPDENNEGKYKDLSPDDLINQLTTEGKGAGEKIKETIQEIQRRIENGVLDFQDFQKAFKPLVDTLKHKFAMVKEQAAQTLGLIGSKFQEKISDLNGLVQALIKNLSDKSDGVKTAASRALGKIGDVIEDKSIKNRILKALSKLTDHYEKDKSRPVVGAVTRAIKDVNES